MRYIEFKFHDEIIRGMIQGDSKNLIIMAHGFTGSRVDHHRFGVLLGNLYESYGYSVLRFDFLGSGESSGDQSFYTPQSEINQLKYIIDQLQDDFDKIYLYGFSYGGVIASQVALEYQDSIESLILLNPAGNMPEVIDQTISVSIPYNGGYDNNGFYFKEGILEEIKSFDTYEGLSHFTKPVYILQGDADQYVTMDSYETYMSTYSNIKGYVLEDCDHCFTSVVRTELMMETMRTIMEEL